VADEALKRLGPQLSAIYSERGRPSIPPEALLKAQILIALYSVRSERLFCERLQYDFLFRWFLDLPGVVGVQWELGVGFWGGLRVPRARSLSE